MQSLNDPGGIKDGGSQGTLRTDDLEHARRVIEM